MKERLSKVECYLREHYEFRYNVVRDQVEWRRQGQDTQYSPQSDYEFNSLVQEVDRMLEAEGSFGFAPARLQKLLHSDFVPRYHPVRDYFASLPHRPGRAAIKALVASVEVADPARFESLLTKWLIAVVANTMNDEGCQNHLCLVLIGPQGVGKTTWLNHLCPPRLRSYLYTGQLAFENKDTLALLSDSLLVNLDDQLRNANRRHADTLKMLLSLPQVELRRAYAARPSRYPRLASFMGSANVGDFLNDPTGARRFLTFDAQDIFLDVALAVNMDEVWAEANTLYQAGTCYWLAQEEMAELNARNERYREPSFEEALVKRHLDVSGGAALKLDEIMLTLTKRADGQRLNTRLVTDALRVLGATNSPRRNAGLNGKPARGWNVAFKAIAEVASAR